jgi:membrane protein DedA with SNARE-associated domain
VTWVHLSLPLVIVVGVAVSLMGSHLAGAAGRHEGEAVANRWSRFLGGRSGLERARRWFDRHSGPAVFIGRLLLAVRRKRPPPAWPRPAAELMSMGASERRRAG